MLAVTLVFARLCLRRSTRPTGATNLGGRCVLRELDPSLKVRVLPGWGWGLLWGWSRKTTYLDLKAWLFDSHFLSQFLHFNTSWGDGYECLQLIFHLFLMPKLHILIKSNNKTFCKWFPPKVGGRGGVVEQGLQ